VDILKLFFKIELIDKTVEETNGYTEQFLCGHKISRWSTARVWKPVVLDLFMRMGIMQKTTLRSYFTTKKRVISKPGFGDIITRDRLELICIFLHFSNNETISSFQGS
jgi:hypothetical protein